MIWFIQVVYRRPSGKIAVYYARAISADTEWQAMLIAVVLCETNRKVKRIEYVRCVHADRQVRTS